MKRNVLASFTDVLLLPVTIVPRTTVAVGKAFGAALTQGGNAAVQGIAMLNPQRWGAAGGQWGNGTVQKEGYGQFGSEGAMVFDIGEDEDDDDEKTPSKTKESKVQGHNVSGMLYSHLTGGCTDKTRIHIVYIFDDDELYFSSLVHFRLNSYIHPRHDA